MQSTRCNSNYDGLALILFFGSIFGVVGICLFTDYRTAAELEKLEASRIQDAASFERIGMRECHANSTIVRSRNSCINEVVGAARNTRGEHFAQLVGQRLAKAAPDGNT